MRTIGRTTWAISGGRIPLEGTGPEPEMTGHGTLCLLNVNRADARVEITFYHAGRDPVGPYEIEVPARRTRHVRVNDLIDPEAVPLESDYGAVITADVPVVVQFTGMDTRRAANARVGAVAFPVEG